MAFNLNVLRIDPARELERLKEFVTHQVRAVFRRKAIII